MADDINLTPASIASESAMGRPTIYLRSYLSSHHLWAARHFAAQAQAREEELGEVRIFDIQHRAFVLAAIQSSVCFLEATINEIYQDAADGHTSYVEPLGVRALKLLAEVWTSTEAVGRQLGTLDRYQFSLVAADKAALDRGTRPYDAASLLIRLRNAVVHFRPVSQTAGELDRLGSQLDGKFPRNPLMRGAGNPPFPDHFLSSGCAEWAVDASTTFTDEVMRRLGITANYQRASLGATP